MFDVFAADVVVILGSWSTELLKWQTFSVRDMVEGDCGLVPGGEC